MTIENICNNCQLVTIGNRSICVSYGTPVFSWSPDINKWGSIVRRHWSGWSATTQRHINKCADVLEMPHIDKKYWNNMNVVPADF